MSVTERRVAPAEPIQASGSGGSETPRLEVHEISKHFGSVIAVDRVSFSVGRGEVVGLLGDNGAGKSTIIKMISGALRPDSGYLALDGKRLNLRSAKDARRAGIATVYQDLGLVTTMSVWRNFFLGAELRKNLLFFFDSWIHISRHLCTQASTLVPQLPLFPQLRARASTG